MQDLARQLTDLRQQVLALHDNLADAEVVGSAGNGLVRITMTATGEFRSVHIDSGAVDPTEVHQLESLVLAALHDAAEAVRRLAAGAAQQLNESAARLGRPGA
jgi:DNA-binding YbaB/EbfC family protein